MALRGGIHELIPMIVLAALGIAFAFIALDYATSSWGSVKPRSTELLRLGVDSYVAVCPDGSGVLALHVFNRGMHDITVYRVELVGYGWWIIDRYRLVTARPSPSSVCGLALLEAPGGEVVLRHGFEGWLVVAIPTRVAGMLPETGRVPVKLYTEMGVLFLAEVPVAAGG